MSADNIKVAIKVRPVIKRQKDNVYWKISNNSIQQIESQAEPFYFDHIFDQCSSNQDVFNTVVKPIVTSYMEGINGTIFVYGQTSSGKTYTMLGDEQNPGVINLAIKEIFSFIQKSLERLFLLRVGYIEIYNEKIYDLLNKDNKDLKIHELTTGEVTVNCTEFIVTTETEILKYLQKGNKLRKCGETNMNERSSRSHAIFKLTIESRVVQKNQVQEVDNEPFQISTLNLVDLAGSERADQTGATGSRLKEGSHINKSLLSLGCVIKSLSDSVESDSFINYRNSKLTRILRASLGGNALTAIICNIKLTTNEETNSTLNFAMRAKTIKNKPHVNEVISDAAMMRILEKKVAKLQCELEKERRKNGKLKVLELEKQIKMETHKIVNSQFLKNVQFDSNRRRTWCPSLFGNDSTQNVKNHFQDQSKLSEPKKFISRIPNFLTPLITLRNDAKNNFILPENEDGLFKESPASNNIFRETICENANYFQTPKLNKNSEKLDSSNSPSLKEMYNILEKEYKELVAFTNLEKKIGVDHEVVNSLFRQLDACRSELSKKDEKIQSLMITKLDLGSDIENFKIKAQSKDDHITELQKTLFEIEKKLDLEVKEKVSIQYEFEQLKQKSKVREDELLGLIQEKDQYLSKIRQNRKNIETFQEENSKIHNNLCRLCNNCFNKFYCNKTSIISNFALKSNIIKMIDENTNILDKMYGKLISKYFKAESAFKELESKLENIKADFERKTLKFNEMSLKIEQFENFKNLNEIEKSDHLLLKNKFELILEENSHFKVVITKNNVLINTMEQECFSLKNFAFSLIGNMKKLEREHEVILKKNSINMKTLRKENKNINQKFHKFEEVFNQKNRKLNACENVIQKLSLNIPLLKHKLAQIDALLRSETTKTSENFEILKKQLPTYFSNTEKIPLLENALNKTEFPPNLEKQDWYENEVSCLKRKVKFFEKQNNELQNSNDNMKIELPSLRNENEDLSEKIVDAITNLDTLTVENDKIKIVNEVLTEEVNHLKIELNLKVDETQKLQLKNHEMNCRFKEIQTQNENLSKQLDKFLLNESALNEQNRVLKCTTKKVLLDNNNIEVDQFQNLQIVNENLVKKLGEKEKEVKKSNSECDSLKQRTKEIEAKNENQIRIIAEENKTLLTKLGNEMSQSKGLREENEILKKEICDITSFLSQYKEQIQSNKLAHSKEREEYKKVIEKLKTEINQLKLKNQKLQDEVEIKEQKYSENWRRLRRQNYHDEIRSFTSESSKDVSIMTDYTNESCNCNNFADKISELKKALLLKDCQIVALNLKVDSNSMVDEIQKLKKELLNKETERKKLNENINALKEKIDEQSQKYSVHLRQVLSEEKRERKKLNEKLQQILIEKENILQYNTALKHKLETQENNSDEKQRTMVVYNEVEKEKFIKEIQQLKAEIEKYEKKFIVKNSCILQEKIVQTEYIENDLKLKHLQEINQDLKNICRHRQSKIIALKEEIQNLKKNMFKTDFRFPK